MDWLHERSHYRVRYPTAERPRLWSGRCTYAVVDCCEGGVRYDLGQEPAPRIGEKVGGRLRFREGVEVTVEGVVIRVRNGEVALS